MKPPNSVVTESRSDREAASRQQHNDSVQMIKLEQTEESKEKIRSSEEGDSKEYPDSALPLNVQKALRRMSSSAIRSDSLHSNTCGSGNNSDNSGFISIGNGSFGFNFDNEEMNNSDGKTNDSDSDVYNPPDDKVQMEVSKQAKNSETMGSCCSEGQSSGGKMQTPTTSSRGGYLKSSVSSLTQPSDSDNNRSLQASNDDIAAAVVAHLHSIAKIHEKDNEGAESQNAHAENILSNPDPVGSVSLYACKRPPRESDEESGGYNSDGDESEMPTQRGRPRKRTKKVDGNKREERNQREKERSFRISKQINELRNLLSSGGVVVPKGTKSSVLTEAASYIRMLQKHQYQSEIDRHQLVQQMQMIGGGALGQQASTAIRHVAAQNGVWSLGNFGGVPPNSAMTFYQGTEESTTPDAVQCESTDVLLTASMKDHDYRFVFNSSPVGMAVASMGGALIDCNKLFCQLSNYSKQEVCSMTIFNFTSRQDLHHAFDLISKMISPPSDASETATQKPKPCVLRGAMKDRDDLGLSVALIRGDDGIAKCFCVTLVKNPASPFDTSRPTPATSDLIIPSAASAPKGMVDSSPAFTSG